jgi:hypothetical protein
MGRLVLAMARPLAHDEIAAREYPVEVRVVMDDGLQVAAEIAEHLADLRLAVGQALFWEMDLCVLREEIEDCATGRSHSTIVERLQIFECDRFALLVGHRLRRQCHGVFSDRKMGSFLASRGNQRRRSALAALAAKSAKAQELAQATGFARPQAPAASLRRR